MKDLTNDDIRRLQDFLFKAIAEHGWAAGVQGIVVPDMPGCEENVWEEGDYLFRERHGILTSSAPRFFDEITVFFQEQKIWEMKYFGRYDKHVIPFLRAARMQNCTEDAFIEGRDISRFQDSNHPGLLYEDTLLKGGFVRFVGQDRTYVKSHEEKATQFVPGFGHYMGGIVART